MITANDPELENNYNSLRLRKVPSDDTVSKDVDGCLANHMDSQTMNESAMNYDTQSLNNHLTKETNAN